MERQAVGADNGTGDNKLVFTIAASAGTVGGLLSTLVVLLGPRSTVTITSVTDNIDTLGLTWVVPTFQNPEFIATNIPAGAYCIGAAAGVTTITVHLSGTAPAAGFAFERDDIVSYIDAIIHDNASLSVPSWSAGNVAATGPSVGYGWTSTGTTGIPFVPGSGWSALAGTGIVAGSVTNTPDGDEVFAESKVFPSSVGGTYAADGTTSPTTNATQNSGFMLFAMASNDGTYQLTSDLYF